ACNRAEREWPGSTGPSGRSGYEGRPSPLARLGLPLLPIL
ncbi:MAG: hypothetical protein AVDCRST_MAG18-2019, partial [uncultured Thermomicrobiales bacterium]